MSLILKKLEQKGLLTVKQDEKDKRVKKVLLTEAGRAAKTTAEAVPAQMLCKFQGMTADEARQLVTLIDKLQGCFQS